MNSNLPYLIIIGITVMLLMALTILMAVIHNQRKKDEHRDALSQLKEQQQNQLIEAAVRSEETERHRIAETLHDEVGAILSSAKLHLFGIKTELLQERDQKMQEKGRDLLNDVIQKVRGISHNLHSNILKEFGLNEAIRHFLRKVVSGTGMQADTDLDDRYLTSNADRDISLYRLVQELINNILKYADASRLMIKSSLLEHELLLSVHHNGLGLTQSQFEELRYQKEGLGLKNIQNRMILLKGTILFSQDADGYRIDIRTPITKPEVLNA